MSAAFAGIIAVTMQMQIEANRQTVIPAPVVIIEEANPHANAELIRCTCYIDEGITYTGEEVREGIVATCKEWLGSNIALYENDGGEVGELIGIYYASDTGYGIDTEYGGTIELGQSIDVWLSDIEAVNEWQKTYRDYVYMELLD